VKFDLFLLRIETIHPLVVAIGYSLLATPQTEQSIAKDQWPKAAKLG
jgi:hypothetical protein